MNRLIRLPLALVLGVALIGAIGCGSGSSSGGEDNSSGTDTDLIVQQVLPTNGQEVASDLIDVGGEITVVFSAPVESSAVLDFGNGFNGLTSSLNVLDSAFLRVPGTPTLDFDTGRGNVLTFVPSGGVLPNGQYTVTASRDITSTSGKTLNRGAYDHRSSFTVGTDTYKPVIRNTFPVQDQKDVPKDSQVIVIFNESVDPSTVTLSSFDVRIPNPQAGQPNQPQTIQAPGTLTTSRDDFEIVWTPSPDTLLPPNTTVTVTVYGGASGITDNVGNTFEDPTTNPPGSSWQFSFETVTEPPPPNNPLPVVIVAGTPGDALIVYADNTSIGTLQAATYYPAFGGTWPDLTGWLTNNPIPNSYKRIGQPTEIIVDQRFGATDGHTWMYVADSASGSITVVGTRDCQIVGRWKALPDPVGIGYTSKTLYVSNYNSNTISAVDLARTSVGAARFNDVVKTLADPGERLDIEVGRGPYGVAYSLAAPIVFVANNIEHSCTLINATTAQHLTTFNTGTSPWDIATTPNYPNIGYFAFISCKGGGSDLDGSVSVYWNAPNGLQADVRGFKNPQGIIFDYGASAWVANSGGKDTSQLTLQFAGGGFAATIFPAITATVETGANPTDVTIEPAFPAVRQPVQTVITANRGDGTLSFLDATQPSRAIVTLPVPGVKLVAAWLDQ